MEKVPTTSEQRAPEDAAVILVVDDDRDVREVTARVLQQVGYTVLQADEGERAIELVRSHPGRLDLLLTDVIMPGMSGRELSRRVAEERPGTRVLFMSAYTEDEVILRGIRVNEMNFLYKPFSLDALRDAVKRAIED